MSISIPLTRSKSKGAHCSFEILKTPMKKLRKNPSPHIYEESLSIINKSIASVDNVHNDKENVFNRNIIIDKPSHEVVQKLAATGAKILQISHDEKTMCGAPESDLYEVHLIQDDDLEHLSDSSMSLPFTLESYRSATIWADKFHCAENMRKYVRFHNGSLSLDYVEAMIDASLSEIESLRSSSCRNGLYLLRCLARLINVNLYESHLKRVLDILVHRVGKGPKFIATEASDVLKTVVAEASPVRCIQLLTSHASSKNVDVVEVVYESVLQSMKNISSFEGVESGIQMLYAGLSSKSVAAKDKSKKFFLHLKQTNNQHMLNGYLTESQVSDVARSIFEKEAMVKDSFRPPFKAGIRSALAPRRIDDNILINEDPSLVL